MFLTDNNVNLALEEFAIQVGSVKKKTNKNKFQGQHDRSCILLINLHLKCYSYGLIKKMFPDATVLIITHTHAVNIIQSFDCYL